MLTRSHSHVHVGRLVSVQVQNNESTKVMMPRWSTTFTQYSGTCLLRSLMGHKYLALLERWLEYTGPLHSGHVKL